MPAVPIRFAMKGALISWELLVHYSGDPLRVRVLNFSAVLVQHKLYCLDNATLRNRHEKQTIENSQRNARK